MKMLAKWSVEDYPRTIEAGILRDRHVELLAGEIVEMSPETPIHYSTAKRGAKYLTEAFVIKRSQAESITYNLTAIAHCLYTRL